MSIGSKCVGSRRVVALLMVLVAVPLVGVVREGAGRAEAGDDLVSSFVPVVPTRLADTRLPVCGCSTVGVNEIEVQVTGGSSGVPAGASAAVLTLTIAAPEEYGFLTAYPADVARPNASSVNVSRAGVTIANTQIIPLSATGAVRVYASTQAFVIVDVTGYFMPAPSGATAGRFQPTAPIRLADTRQQGQGGIMNTGEVRTFDPAPKIGVGYSAVALNITMTGTTGLSYLTVWPSGQAQPNTSSVNADAPGESRAAFAIVPTSDMISVFASSSTHVVIDIVGIFTDDTAGQGDAGLFVPVTPTRWVDTRLPGQGGLFGIYETRNYTHDASVPVGASVVGNVTMAGAKPGYMTAFRTGDAMPATSTVNSSMLDSTIANGAVLTLSAGNQMSVRSSASSYLIVDEFGWFTPSPVVPDPGATTTTTIPKFVGCTELPIDAFNDWRADEGVAALEHSHAIYLSACKWAMALVTGTALSFSYWDYGVAAWVTDEMVPSGHSPGTFRAFEWGVSGSPDGPPAFTYSSSEVLAAFADRVATPDDYGLEWWLGSPPHYNTAVNATYKTAAIAQACGYSPQAVWRCAEIGQFASATAVQLP